VRIRPLALLLIPFLFAPSAFAAEPANPHISPDGCVECHIAVPTPENAAMGDYFLIRTTIDETCKSCHAKDGCAIGVNQAAHPSGIEILGADGSGPHPHSLPLYGGKIACTTCHFNLMQPSDSYRRVRLSEWRNGEPDLSRLCADCHGEG
jgi:hypothetical protein